MRTRTRLLLGGAVVIGTVSVASAGWIAWTAREVRAELVGAQVELGPLRDGVLTGDAQVPARIARLQARSAAAREVTSDPVWTAVAGLPVIGNPVETVRGLTVAVDSVASQSLPALAAAATDAHPARLLDSGVIDVKGLAAAAEPLGRADEALRAQRDAVAALPEGWLPPVSSARAELLDQLRNLSSLTTAAHTASGLAPGMLGRDGARRYFVAFQNPAEARGTGGLLDAFAIVRADQGRVVVERTGANTQLPELPETVDGLDEAFVDRYGAQGATALWLNANLSPHLPEVGAAWVTMWRAATGENLDGVVVLDPTALADVLSATGPVKAPVVGTVGAERIEKLVLLEQYQRADLAAERKQLMLQVGVNAMNAVLAGKAPATELVPALNRAARSGHLMLYSEQQAEQATLVRSGLAGAVPDTIGPFAQAVVVNAAGNKLDTWLGQSLAYRVVQCSSAGREVSVTVSLTNSAPADGLPDYVTVRSDEPSYTTVEGQNRVGVQVLVTHGAVLRSATLDGAVIPQAAPENDLPTSLPAGGVAGQGQDGGFLTQTVTAGRPSYGMDVEIKPGARRTMVLQLREPAGLTGPPRLPVQTMVVPATASADVSACGVGS